MGLVDRYKKIFKGDVGDADILLSHIPKPNDIDYQRGYIVRFFAQKTIDSNSPIIEINQNVYLKTLANPQYRTTQLRWRISGSNVPKYDSNGVLVDNSVSESNRISVKLASTKIKNLKLYLLNLLQFYK